ncbi:hypothetical protein [Candidatus Nitrosocosmicus franklandus]|uniref:Uncharacterized protein n=1 Tax=Candidatus Nitrosocosmicus franklandianus TaxID=1798806 RepID=A0A484I9V3_9ARCH|nr:hypothetical protein [Candidatus Nitrosocosmicus franklandus]VFJ13886.1 conserved protein of unknown function [Candidatus Nitrosocosmicus franklandus]
MYVLNPITSLATTQPLNNNTTTTINPDLEVESITNAFGEPFYILNDSKNTGHEVIGLDPQQTKSSYIAQGNMQGLGNVTEYGIFITTYSSPISSSVGKGLIVKGDQVVTFTAQDIGSYDKDGNLLLKGAINFESDDPEMSKINGKMGFYIYWESTNGTYWTKTWLWD